MHNHSGVRKRRYQFASGDAAIKYEEFLKDNICSLDPIYYGVISYETVETDDGPMTQVELTQDVSDPNLEVMAVCTINNQAVCLWGERVWTVGVFNVQDAVMCGLIHTGPMDIANGTNITTVIYPLAEDTNVVK